jgi:hypothetical protein
VRETRVAVEAREDRALVGGVDSADACMFFCQLGHAFARNCKREISATHGD